MSFISALNANEKAPLWVCHLSLAGLGVAAYFPILALVSGAEHNVVALSQAEVAYVTIFSALLWLMSALSGEKYSNAAAATFTASAGFFASATFALPSHPGNDFVWAEEYRASMGYYVGMLLPVLLVIALYGPRLREWLKQMAHGGRG